MASKTLPTGTGQGQSPRLEEQLCFAVYSTMLGLPSIVAS